MKNISLFLDSWIRHWEGNFPSANKSGVRTLLFRDSFANIARLALSELERVHKSKPTSKPSRTPADSWGVQCLLLLEKYLANPDVEIELLEKDFSAEMSTLQTELKGQHFDLARLLPCLQTIAAGPSTSTIATSFCHTVLLDDPKEYGNILDLSDEFLISRLGRNNTHELKDFAKSFVAKFGAEAVLEGASEKLAIETALPSKLIQDYFVYLAVLPNERSHFSERYKPDEGNLIDIFNSGKWYSVFRDLMETVAGIVSKERRKLRKNATSETIIAMFDKNETIHERVGSRVLQLYVRAFLTGILLVTTERDARIEDSDLSYLTLPLGDWLYKNIPLVHDMDGRTPHRPDTVDLVATTAFNAVAIDFLSDKLNRALKLDDEELRAVEIGRTLCRSFAKFLQQIADDEEMVDSDVAKLERVDPVVEWSETIALHKLLATTLRELNGHLVSEYQLEMKILASRKVSISRSRRSKFWKAWVEKFIAHSGFWSGVYKRYDWNRLPKRAVRRVFQMGFDQLIKGDDKWTVMINVDNLDAKGRMWTTGGIIFFDPEAFYSLESSFHHDRKEKTHTVARIDCSAPSEAEAVRKAWKQLNLVLGNIGLTLSSNPSYGGFEVEPDPSIYVKHRTSKSASIGWKLHRYDKPIRQSVEALEGFVEPVFRKLNEKFRKGDPLTELELRFTAAVHWYNKGRWRFDPVESYLFYWIGVETLFGGSEQRALFNGMSRLAINWRDSLGKYSWYFTNQHRRDLIRMIAENAAIAAELDSRRSLRNWQRDRRVLLDQRKIRQVIKLAEKHDPKVSEYALRYYEGLKPFWEHRTAFEADVVTLQSRFKLKLLELKRVRNEIMHSGLSEHPSMVLYSDEIEDIFEGLLVQVGNSVARQPPVNLTMESLIDDFAVWWIQ